MAMILLVLNKPEAIVRGVLRNALFEPQPNLFIGRLDSKRITKLVTLLEDRACNALLVCENRRNSAGLSFKIFGSMPDRHVLRIDGLDFVVRKSRVESSE
jgi:CRISPR-associated endoribonuclease Cas2 subtype I-E